MPPSDSPPERSRRLRGTRGVLAGAILVVAAALLGLAVNDVLLSDPLSATGVVQPTSAAQLNMAATGPIAAIPVHVGETVTAGQVLATPGHLFPSPPSWAPTRPSSPPTRRPSPKSKRVYPHPSCNSCKTAVSSAQVQLTSAQQKLTTTTTTSDADVSAAAAQVSQ